MPLTALLVGSNFRSQARKLLSLVSPGVRLQLVSEPENPHDYDAVAVWIDVEDQDREYNPALGRAFLELNSTRVQLGYLARASNRQLRALPDHSSMSSNTTVLAWMREAEASGHHVLATLHWGPNGETRVRVEFQEPKP